MSKYKGKKERKRQRRAYQPFNLHIVTERNENNHSAENYVFSIYVLNMNLGVGFFSVTIPDLKNSI